MYSTQNFNKKQIIQFIDIKNILLIEVDWWLGEASV